jgi:hypothetical protein
MLQSIFALFHSSFMCYVKLMFSLQETKFHIPQNLRMKRFLGIVCRACLPSTHFLLSALEWCAACKIFQARTIARGLPGRRVCVWVRQREEPVKRARSAVKGTAAARQERNRGELLIQPPALSRQRTGRDNKTHSLYCRLQGLVNF